MNTGEFMKKIILIIISLLIILYIIINYPVNHDQKYQKMLYNTIKVKKYSNIIDITKSNDYYLVETQDNIYVLEEDLNEVENIDKNSLKEIKEEYTYSYDNQLMYEIKKYTKDYLIYKYYNARDNEYIKEIKIRR